MRKTPSLLIAATFAVLTVAVWGLANRPTPEPAWPSRVQGFSFQPFQKHQNAITGDMPTAAEIDEDLALLAGKAQTVRTYSVLGTLGEVPAMAARHGMAVTIGAWLGADRERNDNEVERTIQLANRYSNVSRIIVGNEVVLRGDLTLGDLEANLDHVRGATRQPVSTAEPWHVWIAHPELADHVDYIAVHMLPYWEGVAVDTAVDYVAEKIERAASRPFPASPSCIAEVGWPSNGRTRESAVASQSNEAMFLRRFLARARQRGLHLLPDGGLRPALEGAVRGLPSAPTGASTTSTASRSSRSGTPSCESRSGRCWPRHRSACGAAARLFFCRQPDRCATAAAASSRSSSTPRRPRSSGSSTTIPSST